MARYMDLLYHTVVEELPQFGPLPDDMKYGDAVTRIRQAGGFIKSVLDTYNWRMARDGGCIFCARPRGEHSHDCPMVLTDGGGF